MILVFGTQYLNTQIRNMETRLLVTDKNKADYNEIMEEAGRLIKAGELVAFPTETVYGLGGNALDETASGKIYAAKGRPSDNPLIVHIADFKDLESIVSFLPKEAKMLADRFWPGPLTMRFKKNDRVPDATTGGLDTVAVRMPDHQVALDFIRAAGGFIAAPSANTSGRPSPTKADHVYEDMKGRIPMILDGGQVGIGIESTIVDLAEDEISILRPGYITREMVMDCIGKPVTMDPSIHGTSEDDHPKAPGMKYRHYAPKASLSIVEGDNDSVLVKIKELILAETAAEKRVGLMISQENLGEIDKFVAERGIERKVTTKIIGSQNNEASIAHELYGILRDYDHEEVDVIYTESVSKEGLGAAVYNRLIRAAGHNVIKA